MARITTFTLIGAAALLSACASTTAAPPVDVMRFHLGGAIERSTVMVEPGTGLDAHDPDYQAYAAAVENQLHGLGYVSTPTPGTSAFIAVVKYTRELRGEEQRRPPVSVGFGGGTYGRHTGVGGGVSFGFGGRRRDLVATELSVELRRRADNTVVWEGHAVMSQAEAAGQPVGTGSADRLAYAMFKDFPGESGITTRVK